MKRKRPAKKETGPEWLSENGSHVSRLVNRYKDEDVFICGTGTSLFGFDWSRLSDKITIALNEAIKVPDFNPTFHLFSDSNLYKSRKRRNLANPSGEYELIDYHPETSIVCQRPVRKNFIVDPNRTEQFKKRVYQFNILPSPATIKFADHNLFISRTVATGAICLAWKLGARRIFLLGVDGYKKRYKRGPSTEEMYYHDGSTKPKEKRKEKTKELDGFVMVVQDRHEFWQKQMSQLYEFFRSNGDPYPSEWPGPGVYNCSLLSTIQSWEKIPIDKVLPCHSKQSSEGEASSLQV
jgi:hypothetical protein